MADVGRLAAGWALRSVFAFAVWLALVDTTQTPELSTGLVCAVLAGALATAVRGHRVVEARVRASYLRHLHRPFVLLVTDTARVTWALVAAVAGRGPRGRFRAARWHAEDDDAGLSGRRALVELLGTMGPNRVVLGIDPVTDAILVHELVPDASPLDPLELG